MFCDLCHKNAAILHLEEVSQKGSRKINLCIKCAKENGFKIGFKVDNKKLMNFMDTYTDQGKARRNLLSEDLLQCINCGTTLKDITKHEKAGCPQCYKNFDAIIDLIVLKNNNSLTFKGKLPEDIDEIRLRRKEIRKLKLKLNNLIEEENYKEAALIRDKIKDLRGVKESSSNE